MVFYVGQKVEYVCDPPEGWFDVFYRWLHPYKNELCKGVPYTVANVYVVDGETGLEIVEVPAPATKYWCAGWLAACFRPLVEKKTDISIFTAMLAPKHQQEDA